MTPVLVGWAILAAILVTLVGFGAKITWSWRKRWFGEGCWRQSGVRFRQHESLPEVSPEARRSLNEAARILSDLRTGRWVIPLKDWPDLKLRIPNTAVELYADGAVPPDRFGARDGGMKHGESFLPGAPIWRVPLIEAENEEAGFLLLHEVLRHSAVFETTKSNWDPNHLLSWAADLEIRAKDRLADALGTPRPNRVP